MPTYQTAYRSSYRPRRRRRRRRRRNSHYGVLLLLIVLFVAVVFFAVRGVWALIGMLTGSGSKNEVVYQIYNGKAFAADGLTDLEGAPYLDNSGAALIPAESLELLGPTVDWDAANTTVVITLKKNTIRVQTGSRTLRLNDEIQQMSSEPATMDNVVFVPAQDVCGALGWQVNLLEADKGQFVIVSKSKHELSEKKLAKIAAKALEELGPSRGQVEDGCIIMRIDSDKVYFNGETVQMTSDSSRLGNAVITQDGITLIPLQAALATLGGTAMADEDGTWSVTFETTESSVTAKGKARVGGRTVKGDGLAVFTNDNGVFYVSAPMFAALIGRYYVPLEDGSGSIAFTKMSLDGYDSQKAYLDTLEDGLTEAVGGDVPEADVYVALTFDDGPTGATEKYPDGFTAMLLDELKKRNVHVTFFLCGYRVKDFHGHMSRYLAEGHEVGNHTMDHPAEHLTGLSAEEVREQVESNSELIESYTNHPPTVMRPVGGGVNDTVKSIMKELGLPIINWSVDTNDWQTRTDPDSVKNVIVNQVEDGSIVLMHDMYSGTFEGVLAAIDELQSRTDKTYAFVTVSELAAVHGITLEPGVVYNNLSYETAQGIKDGTYAAPEFLSARRGGSPRKRPASKNKDFQLDAARPLSRRASIDQTSAFPLDAARPLSGQVSIDQTEASPLDAVRPLSERVPNRPNWGVPTFSPMLEQQGVGPPFHFSVDKTVSASREVSTA